MQSVRGVRAGHLRSRRRGGAKRSSAKIPAPRCPRSCVDKLGRVVFNPAASTPGDAVLKLGACHRPVRDRDRELRSHEAARLKVRRPCPPHLAYIRRGNERTSFIAKTSEVESDLPCFRRYTTTENAGGWRPRLRAGAVGHSIDTYAIAVGSRCAVIGQHYPRTARHGTY